MPELAESLQILRLRSLAPISIRRTSPALSVIRPKPALNDGPPVRTRANKAKAGVFSAFNGEAPLEVAIRSCRKSAANLRANARSGHEIVNCGFAGYAPKKVARHRAWTNRWRASDQASLIAQSLHCLNTAGPIRFHAWPFSGRK